MMASIIFQTYVQPVKNVNFPKRILKLSSEREHIHQFITFFLHKIHHPITLTPLVHKLFKRIKERFALTTQSTQTKHISSSSIYPLFKQLIHIIGLSYIFSRQLMVKFSFKTKCNDCSLGQNITHSSSQQSQKNSLCTYYSQVTIYSQLLKKFKHAQKFQITTSPKLEPYSALTVK